MLSDLHFGEVVSKKQVYGFNEYNVKIAERRLKKIGDGAVKVARDYFAGSSKLIIDGAVVVMAGDLVSGDIHEELSRSNEQTTMESVAHFVPLISEEIIGKLYTEFKKIHVVSVAGNHDRLYKKTPSKDTSTSAASWVFGKWIQDRFSDVEGCTFDISEAADAYHQIYSTRFCITHGDCWKASDSVIGALGPVKRGTLKKSFRDKQMGNPFDIILCGHWHSYISAPSQGFICNGSLKSYDEYSARCGFAPEPPIQALFLCTPERGVTFSSPIFGNSSS